MKLVAGSEVALTLESIKTAVSKDKRRRFASLALLSLGLLTPDCPWSFSS